MSDKTGIAWTDATFNPWWGCTKVSPGCDHCYAERDAARFFPSTPIWGHETPRRMFESKHWGQPLAWNARAERAGKRMRVFCASMADVFEKHPGVVEEREKVWTLIHKTPWLDWQLLTKRVGNVERMVPPSWLNGHWPDNAWMGISVVNQEEADRDIPKLLALPARIRWLSCEPLLGPIDLCLYLSGHEDNGIALGRPVGTCVGWTPPVDWVIVGGESGPGARPFHVQWARDIVAMCRAANVPVHVKQFGADVRSDGISGPGRLWPDDTRRSDTGYGHFRILLRDKKGGDPAEWPEDLRVREWPLVAAS